MITAVLYREGENLTGCRLQGHSGWAESGNDIVCAGVSLLTCSCVNALEKVYGIFAQIHEENPQKGILDFDLPQMTEGQNEKAQIVMNVLKQGLEDLTAEYPQNVRLSIKERRKQQ